MSLLEPTRPNRKTSPGEVTRAGMIAVCSLLSLVLLIVLVAGAGWGGARIEGAPRSLNPLAQWSMASTIILTMAIVFVGLVAGLIVYALRRTRRARTRVDSKAHFMASAQDMAGMSTQARRTEVERWGIKSASAPGVPIGRLVVNREPVYSSFEHVRIAIMGPRSGKTTSLCAREVMEAPGGPVVATSNKRDLVDMTRGPRGEVGRIWVHDPQHIIGERASWWWNPLSYVKDILTAEYLVTVFMDATTNANDRQDAYFSTAAKDLLAAYVLAAAVSNERISTLLEWLSKPNDKTAVYALIDAGHTKTARDLEATQQLTAKQRDGVYGTAAPWISFLRDERLLTWVEAQGEDDQRPHFDPYAFATSTDTLYPISREGKGSARAVTAALVMAVLDAAEDVCSTHTSMRLPVPMVVTLDEAANVVRLRQLPQLYSHYGSKGILLSAYVQSWEQGLEAWGASFKQMFSNANVRLIGAGIDEVEFVRGLSEMIGDRDVIQRSTSSSTARGSGTSTSLSKARERILDPSDIRALPFGRAILLSSGYPAAMVALVPFWECPYGPKVSASQSYFEEAARKRFAASQTS